MRERCVLFSHFLRTVHVLNTELASNLEEMSIVQYNQYPILKYVVWAVSTHAMTDCAWYKQYEERQSTYDVNESIVREPSKTSHIKAIRSIA